MNTKEIGKMAPEDLQERTIHEADCYGIITLYENQKLKKGHIWNNPDVGKSLIDKVSDPEAQFILYTIQLNENKSIDYSEWKIASTKKGKLAVKENICTSSSADDSEGDKILYKYFEECLNKVGWIK